MKPIGLALLETSKQKIKRDTQKTNRIKTRKKGADRKRMGGSREKRRRFDATSCYFFFPRSFGSFIRFSTAHTKETDRIRERGIE